MNRRLVTVLALLIVLGAAAPAAAQEIQLEGPLANAPACRGCVLYRDHRFSVAPLLMFSLVDDYRRHITVGARLQYNITDWLAVGIAGGASGFWGDALDTGLTDQVAAKAPVGIDSNRANFPFTADAEGAASARAHTTDLLGRILGFVSAELTFIPFRGKFGLFSRLFLDVDLYVFAGYAIPFVEERGDVDCRSFDFVERHAGGRHDRDGTGVTDADAWNDQLESTYCPYVATEDTVERRTRVAVGAGTYGLGVSIYANHWLGIFLEYRVMPIFWNHTGTDERGMGLVGGELTFCPSDATDRDDDYCGDTGEFPDHRINENDRTWTINHSFTLGASFHFPLTPRRSD